jgi:hypothetical protein
MQAPAERVTAAVPRFVAAPRGADAYRGRVADALTMWAVETEAAFDHHAWRTATWLSALRRLRPPPGAETLHARVVALGERPSADEELAARAEDAAARFAEIEAIRRELAAARASDRDRAYAAAVDDALSECLRSSDTAIAEADAATPRTRRRLERARPPRGAAGAHADLLDAFVAHAVAYRAMLAACRHGDPAGARTAAERVNATAAARDRAWDAIVDALAADVRSPARRGADEAPR